jgi:hypothetical protein
MLIHEKEYCLDVFKPHKCNRIQILLHRIFSGVTGQLGGGVNILISTMEYFHM